MDDALLEARETNKRLNRRLGAMEHDLHSLVSQAQRQANEAGKLVSVAQRQASDANQAWLRSMHRESEASNVAAWCFLALLVTLVWAIGATIMAVW